MRPWTSSKATCVAGESVRLLRPKRLKAGPRGFRDFGLGKKRQKCAISAKSPLFGNHGRPLLLHHRAKKWLPFWPLYFQSFSWTEPGRRSREWITFRPSLLSWGVQRGVPRSRGTEVILDDHCRGPSLAKHLQTSQAIWDQIDLIAF